MRSFFYPKPFGFPTILLFLLCTVSSLMTSSEARANEQSSLVNAMDKVADRVISVLEDLERSKQVSLGDFTSRGRGRSSGGIEIKRQFAESLRGKGITVSDELDNDYTFLDGVFKIIESPVGGDEFDSLGIEITVAIYNEKGEGLKYEVIDAGEDRRPNEIAQVNVFGEEVPTLTGVSYEVEPKDSPEVKQRKIIEQYHNPTEKAVGTKVSSNDLYLSLIHI